MTDRWEIADHVCRNCFGRVLKLARAHRAKTDQPEDKPRVRCSNCGLESEGNYRSICCCGLKVGERQAKLRCVRSRCPSPEFPSEVTAEEVG
jgi:hypothetical protein